MKKISVYIDGQNTYFALKAMEVKGTSKYDYNSLVKFLTDDAEITFIGYYVGQLQRNPSDPKSEKLYEGQQRFLSYLQKNLNGVKIIRGKVMRVDKPSNKCTQEKCPTKGKPIYHEKGVDVRMAIDIVHDAIKNEYDEVIVLSSDSDLIPAIERAQEAGKTVHYVGFQNRKSIALMKTCDITRLLTKEECARFERR